jgi:hypothetical protein
MSYVKGHYRKGGSYVKAHYRRKSYGNQVPGAFGPNLSWEALLVICSFTWFFPISIPLLIIIVFFKLITGGYTTVADKKEIESARNDAEAKRWVKKERKKDERIEKRERLQKMKMKLDKAESKKWKVNERLKEKEKRMKMKKMEKMKMQKSGLKHRSPLGLKLIKLQNPDLTPSNSIKNPS